MPIAYIALGSNLDSEHGTRAQTLTAAHTELEKLGTVTARSSIYETEPVGFRDQARFLNAVVALRTDLEPSALLHQLLSIEKQLGRDRGQSVSKGPRTLDLDLLLMEDRIVKSNELILPHPGLAERRFVLEPLAEIAPDVLFPTGGQTILDLLSALPDEGDNRKSGVRRLPGFW